MLHNHADLAFITKTWLRESIPDRIIHIPIYTLFRRDRIRGNHGRVCIYVQANQLRKFKEISHIICGDDHEILWLHICPNRLPRNYSSIIVGVIYLPPSDNDALIRDHIYFPILGADYMIPLTRDYVKRNMILRYGNKS